MVKISLGITGVLFVLSCAGCKRSPDEQQASGSGAPASASDTAATRIEIEISPTLARAKQEYMNGATAIDLDGDGVPDWTLKGRVGSGPPSREEFDTRRKGRPDIIWEHSKDGSVLSIDHDGDGLYEYTRKFAMSSIVPGGTITTITERRAGDGQPYRLTTITGTKDAAHLDVTVRTADDSGVFVSQESWSQPRQLKTVEIAVGGMFRCTKEFAAIAARGFSDATKRGADCLHAVDHPSAMLYRRMITMANITVDCNDQMREPAHIVGSRTCDGSDPASCSLTVTMNPKQITTVEVATEVAFHELLHAIQFKVGKTHDDEVPNVSDPEDQVYGCNKFCFPKGMVAAGSPPTPSDCERCLAIDSAQDSRCPNKSTSNEDKCNRMGKEICILCGGNWYAAAPGSTCCETTDRQGAVRKTVCNPDATCAIRFCAWKGTQDCAAATSHDGPSPWCDCKNKPDTFQPWCGWDPMPWKTP